MFLASIRLGPPRQGFASNSSAPHIILVLLIERGTFSLLSGNACTNVSEISWTGPSFADV
jgi:hypothetical protein